MERIQRTQGNKEKGKEQGKYTFVELSKPVADFRFAHGSRFVTPYRSHFVVHAKGRWFGRTMMDVFTSEFTAFSKDYYMEAIELGMIRLMDRVVPKDYKIKNGDHIVHFYHAHEPAVSAQPLNIVYETPEILVLDKPASFPIHQCGKYKFNSVLANGY